MILRRIAEGIKNQDWFVVLIEIFIVVIGIYLGLQVDDWNKARQDREDEKLFIIQFHDDLLLSEALASRVQDRRLTLLVDLVSAAAAVFDRPERKSLTQEECTAIGNSRFFNIVISDFPSLTELQNSGRLGIIRSKTLRLAIVELQQKADALRDIVPLQTAVRIDLPNKFPDLVQTSPYFDTDLKEYQQRYQCDLEGMRASSAFKSGISLNLDGYDAYLRDGMLPWLEQFQKVHEIVDQTLGISHEGEAE